MFSMEDQKLTKKELELVIKIEELKEETDI